MAKPSQVSVNHTIATPIKEQAAQPSSHGPEFAPKTHEASQKAVEVKSNATAKSNSTVNANATVSSSTNAQKNTGVKTVAKSAAMTNSTKK